MTKSISGFGQSSNIKFDQSKTMKNIKEDEDDEN